MSSTIFRPMPSVPKKFLKTNFVPSNAKRTSNHTRKAAKWPTWVLGKELFRNGRNTKYILFEGVRQCVFNPSNIICNCLKKSVFGQLKPQLLKKGLTPKYSVIHNSIAPSKGLCSKMAHDDATPLSFRLQVTEVYFQI